MARGEPPRPGPPLPAPYRNPWRGLAEALRAVAADLRLALQRLWRRNREGELPRPEFWPLDLAPLFWPLLISLALVLVVALALGILKGTGPSGGPPGGHGGAPAASGPPLTLTGASAPATAGSPWSAPGSADAGAPASLAEPGAADSAGRPARPDTRGQRPPQPAVPGGPGRAASGEAPTDPAALHADTDAGTPPDAPAAATLRLDPLLELLNQGEGAGLLLAARPDPNGSRLSLTLSDAAEDLPEAELLAWAQRWQQRARDAGYERLELRDRQGRLRGRGALVGSGMILLAPLPTS